VVLTCPSIRRMLGTARSPLEHESKQPDLRRSPAIGNEIVALCSSIRPKVPTRRLPIGGFVTGSKEGPLCGGAGAPVIRRIPASRFKRLRPGHSAQGHTPRELSGWRSLLRSGEESAHVWRSAAYLSPLAPHRTSGAAHILAPGLFEVGGQPRYDRLHVRPDGLGRIRNLPMRCRLRRNQS
jgi:hypothetical protein